MVSFSIRWPAKVMWYFPTETGSLFKEVASLRYPFQIPYNAEDYLANLATQSGTRALGEARSAEFLARQQAQGRGDDRGHRDRTSPHPLAPRIGGEKGPHSTRTAR